MGQADWAYIGTPNKTERSNVMITITDNAAVAEGETVTAVCNNKTFTSTLKNGIAKLYTSEVGTYTITAGGYSTMLVCPYFGVFGTDIYSGTLEIICKEDSGNGKTCQVRHCDNDYNFTDAYNLTQTFDSSLKLSFLGIPAGKYIITIDEKYRYFKEITSIQNVNKIDVEMKQWLYKDGNQCEWNTGGWMMCGVGGSKYDWDGAENSGKTTSSYSQSVEFLQDSIKFKARLYGASVYWVSWDHYDRWSRSGITSYANVGTKKELSLELKKYSELHVNGTMEPDILFRTGALNDANTVKSTPTIIISSKASVVNINTGSEKASLLIGNSYYYKEALGNSSALPAIDVNDEKYVTQIYLV